MRGAGIWEEGQAQMEAVASPARTALQTVYDNRHAHNVASSPAATLKGVLKKPAAGPCFEIVAQGIANDPGSLAANPDEIECGYAARGSLLAAAASEPRGWRGVQVHYWLARHDEGGPAQHRHAAAVLQDPNLQPEALLGHPQVRPRKPSRCRVAHGLLACSPIALLPAPPAAA